MLVVMDIPRSHWVQYYLAQHREDFIGTVKIIFQPAEEGPGGAKPMIEAGVLKNPDVDAIVGLWNNLPLGTVGVRSGALMAAVECFRALIFWQGDTVRCRIKPSIRLLLLPKL